MKITHAETFILKVPIRAASRRKNSEIAQLAEIIEAIMEQSRDK